MNIVCWAFGHREQERPDGDTMCLRCGATDEGENYPIFYNRAGVLLRWLDRKTAKLRCRIVGHEFVRCDFGYPDGYYDLNPYICDRCWEYDTDLRLTQRPLLRPRAWRSYPNT